MVLGIVSLAAWVVPPLGLVVSVAAITLGLVVLARSLPNRGRAIAGLVTGSLGLIGAALGWGFLGALILIGESGLL